MKNKNYLKALKAIETKRAELIPVKREYDFRQDVRNTILSDPDKSRAELHETIKALETERAAARDKNNFIYHEIKLLENNAKIALIADVLPVIIDETKKYINKPYGEKTAAKIKENIKAVTGCAVYIHKDEITIIPLNKDGFSYGVDCRIYTSYSAAGFLTDENKLNDFTSLDIKHGYGETVKNTAAHVKKILNAYENAKKAATEYNNAIKNYNALVMNTTIKTLNYARPIEYIFYS